MEEDPNIEQNKKDEKIDESKQVSETISQERATALPAQSVTEKQETANNQPQTEKMEVQKHPHHIMHKKKWGEYLLEFFMIFFAVTLGFFAENIREHSVEKERARQYINSFYNDLLNDTAEFALLISEYESTVKGLEGRNDCFLSIEQHAESNECLQQLFNISSGFTDLITNDQTLQQLKNSGNFRLLPPADADSMLLYDKMIRTYVKQETTGLQENQYNLRNVISSLQNYKRRVKNDVNTKEPILFSENKELVNRYFNLLDDYLWRRRMFLGNLILLKQKAISLIDYFKNSYHLK